jgi:hypothetical protein
MDEKVTNLQDVSYHIFPNFGRAKFMSRSAIKDTMVKTRSTTYK